MSHSEMFSLTQASPRSRIRSLLTVAFGAALFLIIVGLVSKSLRLLLQNHIAETVQSRATVVITGSALGEIAV